MNKKETNLTCPGCGSLITSDEFSELYHGDYWHDICARGERIVGNVRVGYKHLRSNVVIYYHPTFDDSSFYFTTEQEAIEFCANWLGMHRATSLEQSETMTVVFM